MSLVVRRTELLQRNHEEVRECGEATVYYSNEEVRGRKLPATKAQDSSWKRLTFLCRKNRVETSSWYHLWWPHLILWSSQTESRFSFSFHFSTNFKNIPLWTTHVVLSKVSSVQIQWDSSWYVSVITPSTSCPHLSSSDHINSFLLPLQNFL